MRGWTVIFLESSWLFGDPPSGLHEMCHHLRTARDCFVNSVPPDSATLQRKICGERFSPSVSAASEGRRTQPRA